MEKIIKKIEEIIESSVNNLIQNIRDRKLILQKEDYIGYILESHITDQFKRIIIHENNINKEWLYWNELNIKPGILKLDEKIDFSDKETSLEEKFKEIKKVEYIRHFMVDLLIRIFNNKILIEFKNDNEKISIKNSKYIYDLIKLNDFTSILECDYGLFIFTSIKTEKNLSDLIQNKIKIMTYVFNMAVDDKGFLFKKLSKHKTWLEDEIKKVDNIESDTINLIFINNINKPQNNINKQQNIESLSKKIKDTNNKIQKYILLNDLIYSYTDEDKKIKIKIKIIQEFSSIYRENDILQKTNYYRT